MKNELATVKNPLTVIAIFAGLAEVAGTSVLPFIAEPNQITYIWFLMLFPTFLVTIFFITLNFNPKVLYAPSDFEDEQNYMDLFRPSSTSEKLQKIEVEMQEEQSDNSPSLHDTKETDLANASPQVLATKERLLSLMQRDVQSRYMLAESLIIDRLTSEFKTTPKRDLILSNRFGNHSFDAAFEAPKGLVLVEIKLFSERTPIRRMRETLERIQASFSTLPEEVKKNARFLLAIAYEMPKERAIKIDRELSAILAEFPIPMEIRMYELQDLINNV